MIQALYGRVFVLDTYQRGGGGGGHWQRHISWSATELCVLCGPSVQVTQLLTEIGIPSIINRKTRNIAPKLNKYWPTLTTLEIQHANAGPMRPICRFQIVLVAGQIKLSRPTKPKVSASNNT